MKNENLVLIAQFCLYHEVEQSFILSLREFGLIEVFELKNELYLSNDEISKLEKFIRLHYELGINLEGIDAVYRLLKQIDLLQQDLVNTKNRLQSFGPDNDQFNT